MNSPRADLPVEAAETIELARALVRIDTSNPPGNERQAADLIAARFAALGVDVARHVLAPGRDSLVVRLNASRTGPVICFSGHLDTVPLGTQCWTRDPLGGEIVDGRIWGRGTTDMKGGVAAMVTAFERLARRGSESPAILVLSASEETGCQGAAGIADQIGSVGALVIAEPTNNTLALAHKGALWLRLTARGQAAHGSMPHLGTNAIDLMADAIAALRALEFDVDSHPVLGAPTKNIGTISGGAATNIVPDLCVATLDIRLVPGISAEAARGAVARCIGPAIEIQTLIALDAVASEPDDAWLHGVARRASEFGAAPDAPLSVSYFTDASVLVPTLGMPPVAILGPGDPALAHQVDEACSVAAIWNASQLYECLAQDWSQISSNHE